LSTVQHRLLNLPASIEKLLFEVTSQYLQVKKEIEHRSFDKKADEY